MRKLIILAFLLTLTIWPQAQETTKHYYKDTLVYSSIKSNDTTYYYKESPKTLFYVVIETDTMRESIQVIDGVWHSIFKTITTKGIVLDGICHGTTSTGARCTRKTTKLFCWQHD